MIRSSSSALAILVAGALAQLVGCGSTPDQGPGSTGLEHVMGESESAPWRSLWNHSDPVGTESRLRAALLDAHGDAALEIETQIARALGLQSRFDEARALLDQVAGRADGAGARALVLHALESGRVARSSGDVAASLPHFARAFALAERAGLDFLAIDAAHMLGIVSPAETARQWNERALALATASRDPLARGWGAVALNNQGWNEFDAGRFDAALDLLERALELRRERPDQIEPLWIARWSVARVQRALGRVDEALTVQHALLAEREAAQKPDGYVFEELGECLLALGRATEARPWFARASERLAADPWLVANEPQRLERLARLGAGAASN